MPKVITTTVTVYQLAELTTEAQARAVEAIAEKLASVWWDDHDNEAIGETIRYSLAGTFKTPGHDTYGCGDFPGIPNVTVVGWDLDRGQYVQVKGTLDRTNAPGLPWVDPAGSIILTDGRNGTEVEIIEADGPDCTCDHGGWESTHDAGCPERSYVGLTDAEIENLAEAVTDAIHAAWIAGRQEAEYKSSAEYAREWIESNEMEFLEDGTAYAGPAGRPSTETQYFRTVVVVEILGNTPFAGDAADIGPAITEGDYSGAVLSHTTTEVDRPSMAALLTMHGSEPGFLQAD